MDWQKQMSLARKPEMADPRKWGLTGQFAEALGAQFLTGHQCVENDWGDAPGSAKVFWPTTGSSASSPIR